MLLGVLDEGRLTLGVTPLVAGYYRSEALGRFRRAFPAVQIEVKEDEQPYLEHQIVNGEVDVGILMTNRTIRQEAFDTELLTRSPLRVWLHRIARGALNMAAAFE